ncbi:unnamed protein product [Caenorhabditis auriculariae]|uniref:AMP-dependent synthetase/ligase domain-containing protein n=1 Tax=Caenorhabditis auriculariae TaxID=2777116 RepID=A0A8S1H5Q2_9PELO|nr:unnamed protein product [Caenorhabditis auriculariae]
MDFPTDFRRSMPMQDGHVTIFASSGTLSNKCKFVAHTSRSSQLVCLTYHEKLFDLLVEMDPDYTAINGHHLITSGLHCIDAWSYLYYSLVKGETCVLAESAVDVWRASFLDRIAGLIEQYRIPLILSNAQLLKCFVKYEVHNIYDISSLKLIANSGSPIASHIAKKVKHMLNVAITQAYSAVEFGVVAFELFNEAVEGAILGSGMPLGDIKVKVADADTETEVATGEWGHLMLSGSNLFSEYVGKDTNKGCFAKNWFRSGDYGVIDQKHRIHVADPISNLIKVNGNKLSPEILGCILCEHQNVDDAVVAVVDSEIIVGIVPNENSTSGVDLEDINAIIKKHKINVTVAKVHLLDFIPRSESGKVMRAELHYLFAAEQDDVVLVEHNETLPFSRPTFQRIIAALSFEIFTQSTRLFYYPTAYDYFHDFHASCFKPNI